MISVSAPFRICPTTINHHPGSKIRTGVVVVEWVPHDIYLCLHKGTRAASIEAAHICLHMLSGNPPSFPGESHARTTAALWHLHRP